MPKLKKIITTVAVASLSGFLLAADAPSSGEKKTTPSGLQIVEQGQDDVTAAAGDKVWVWYTGKLQDGTVFDASSNHPDQPFVFSLGQHQVIAGWDEGIAGMKVGQKRQLIIPPELGYGARAIDRIPANSTLVFDVKLLGVQKAG
jgi:peptidylprolyl isomerase